MLKRLSIFFMDDKGAYSMTRLLSFILVISGIVQVFVYSEHYLAGIEMILLGLGGKIGQKFIEKNKHDETLIPHEGQNTDNSDLPTTD